MFRIRYSVFRETLILRNTYGIRYTEYVIRVLKAFQLRQISDAVGQGGDAL